MQERFEVIMLVVEIYARARDVMRDLNTMKRIFRSAAGRRGVVIVAVLFLSSGTGRAEPPRDMTATTPFTQVKATDGSGHVTYRVGGVFAAGKDAGVRLSFTIICEPKEASATLSLLIVRQGASAPASPDSRPITLAVDGKGEQAIKAQRTTQGNIAGYSVTDADKAGAAVAAMRNGKEMLIELDGSAFRVPLQGIDHELADLAKVCPGWDKH
jgi:hypothetical protein